jgi:putative transposase
MTGPVRKTVRIRGFDYGEGAYFVTVCARRRACLFAEIAGDMARVTETGSVVSRCWLEIPEHCHAVELDAFVIMPNHIHGISG